MNLKSKVFFITGASSGIGRALACEVVARGDKVVGLARRIQELRELEQKLGPSFLAVKCDVTSRQNLDDAVSMAVAKFGMIDCAIANAGFGVVGDFENLQVSDYERQFSVNVWGTLHTAYSVLEELKKSKGQLVLIGSVMGYLSLPGASAYAMSKFSIRALSFALRMELAKSGISVTHVAPGFVESEIRNVDNQGVLRKRADDSVPAWLIMPASKAAQKILDGVKKKKCEVVVTMHAKILIFLARHFQSVMVALFGVFRISGRKEPGN